MKHIKGTAGSETLNGTKHADTIEGLGGNDTINGYRGNDKLYGGSGDDHLYGDNDNDMLKGGSGKDYVHGGDGDDTLFGGSGDDILIGKEGNDTMVGGTGDDVLYGGSGMNTYIFSKYCGYDIVVPALKNNDKIKFTNVNSDQLWFSQKRPFTFQINILGSSDLILVEENVAEIKTADNKVLNLHGIQTLILAMAHFATPLASQSAFTATEQAVLPQLIAANWRPA